MSNHTIAHVKVLGSSPQLAKGAAGVTRSKKILWTPEGQDRKKTFMFCLDNAKGECLGKRRGVLASRGRVPA